MRNDQSDNSASSLSSENMGAGVFSIREFCKRNRLSRTKYYDLKKKGLGPREMHYGNRIRITAEAERDWRVKMEKHAISEAALLAAARRKAQTSRAGDRSVELTGKTPRPDKTPSKPNKVKGGK
jgi:hypothetical protein